MPDSVEGDHLSVRCTRLLGGPRQRSLLHLAPDGVWLAGRVATTAGGLLPHRFTLTGPVSRTGGLLSVPLSVGFRRLGIPQRPALWCPDFPRAPEGARGHPACATDGNAISAILASDSARIVRHSGQASA